MSEFVRILVGYLFVLCLGLSVSAATFTVTNTADSGLGSLRQAVLDANAATSDDVIEFSALFNTPQTITLSGTDLIINNNGTLTINGTGADKLTVSGNNASRVFTNNTGAITAINRLRVTGGTGTSTVSTGRGGGVYNNGGTLTLNFLVITGNTTANGGGVNNSGTATLTINNTAIFGNTATGAGGGLQNFSGNTTNIYNSSIYGNTCNSTGTGGGGMQANGTINIVNSTFSGNNAVGGSGGAIYYNGTVLNITNSTFSENISTNGGALHKSGANPLNIRNTIVAANNGAAASPDVSGAVNSLGNNAIGNYGTSTGWIASDFQDVFPLLGSFADNGGFAKTYLLNLVSPAINAGQNCVVDLSCATNNPTIAVNTDQRGTIRPTGSGVDIGAVEINVGLTTVRGQVLSPTGTPIRNASVEIISGFGTLKAARTNSFGYFTLYDIPTELTYLVLTNAKGYTFANRDLNVYQNISLVTITADTGNLTDAKQPQD
jgi:hypothetical protein